MPYHTVYLWDQSQMLRIYLHDHYIDFLRQSQWSQRTITMLIFWSFLGKVNEVNAISHYTHMNCPICWDYLRTFTMLIFSVFLDKSMKSTHDHNDHFFYVF